jgi:hypothetical protein
MFEIIDLGAYKRWDIAGIDGLEMVKSRFGQAVDRIAPFQSLETVLDGESCSVLRLCEGNFRISCSGNLTIVDSDRNYRAWIKQFDWLSAIAVPDSALSHLQKLARPKPPFRLNDLKLNCAIPARIDGIAVLIWRHSPCDLPIIEIHAAQKDLNGIMRLVNSD